MTGDGAGIAGLKQATTRLPTAGPAAGVFRVPAVIGQELARTLSDRIIYLDLQPGAHLAEDEVCSEYQVSRSPVREAFRALEADGLVVRSVRRGVHVSPISRRDLREVYACRVMLEGLAAGEAAANATPDNLVRMGALVDKMTQALARRRSRAFFDSNVAFTQAIHQASANATLIRIAAGVEKQALRYRYLAHAHTMEMHEIAFQGHSTVFTAIAARDVARAEQAGRESIRRAHAVIQKVVEAQFPAGPGEPQPWDTPI
jgi:DNA-binding GntR family transcriptional regulator